MKKRILSVLLTVVMILSVLILPTGAAEAKSNWSFEDEFASLDARNIGQYHIDVGAAETTGVVVDGKVDANDNYTVTQVFNYGYVSSGRVTAQTTTHPDITMKMARKGTTLYIAFIVPETEADSKIAQFQLGMGVSQGPTLSHAVKRVNMFLKGDGTYAWNGLTYYGGPAGKDDANNPNFQTTYIDDYKKTWVADATAPIDGGYSTYEAEIDIDKLAYTLTSTKTTEAVESVRLLQIMFFYYPDGKTANCYYFNPGGAWANENNPYSHMTAQKFVDALKTANGHTYGATGTVIGHPIAFGGEDIELTLTEQDPLGAVGEDVRNLGEGHVIEINAPATVDPVLDGAISDGEYTVVDKLLTHAKAKSPEYNSSGKVNNTKYDNPESQVKANFTYKDGYLYIGITTGDTAIRNTQLDMNVLPYSNFADTMVNRNANGTNTSGVISGSSAYPSIENGSNAWESNANLATRINYGSGKYKFIVDYAANLNSEGKAVYEYKISLATLAEYWKNIYPVSEGYTYFGLQFWSEGNDGYFGGDNDQYGFRSANSIANLKAIDPTAWGLEWVLYTISIPETVDSYKTEHMLRHFYNDIDFKTADTASVRITSSKVNSGLRFKTTFDAKYIENVIAAAGTQQITYGTLIAPTDYVESVSEFTKAALDAKYGAGKGCIDVVADINNPFEIDGDGNVTIAGSITNIKTGNLDRNFSAIAYVKYGDVMIYSGSYATRNVSQIADLAVQDTKAEAEDGYMNKISEGVYSPYTVNQYAILQEMIVKQ